MTSRSKYSTVFGALLAAPIALFAACSGSDGGPSDPGPDDGSIQVTATTTGDDLDADGYTVAVDGGAARNIAPDGSTTFSSIPAGQHQVELSSLAGNCAVTGDNPVAASVSGSATANVSFEVVCDALTGFIQVSTSTSGEDLDPDGYTVTMAGNSDRSIGLNGVTTFSDIAAGQHQVQLTGLADNCAVTGANPAGASVTGSATAQVNFDVTCEALPVGSLEVTTTVTSNFDPDGYQVFVAGVIRGRVDVDGSATFADLPAGEQQVELREIAPNCAVDGDNPATVTIPVGGTGTHSFAVACTSPLDGRIVYTGRVTGRFGIAVMNSDGSGKLLIWECINSCWEPSWSSDGSRVVFQYFEDGWVNLWTIGRDGSDLVRLTSSATDDGSADWSPDGSRLAFTRIVGGRAMIHIIEADGTDLTHLEPPEGRSEARPAWSPDGTRIAVVWRDAPLGISAPWAISVMDADGTNVQEVTPLAPMLDNGYPEHQDGSPAWSPDGSVIAFDRFVDVEDTSRIHVVRPDGTDLVNLTPDLEHSASSPSWSPDGTRIVFEDSNWGVYTMNADGSDVTEIDPPTSSAVDPDWGP